MEMTWAQTLTIVISMAGVSFWIWRVSEKNADKIREETKRHDTEFQETRKLWASLLQKSAEIEKENSEIKKESFIVQQEIRDIKNKSFGVEHEIRELMKKL